MKMRKKNICFPQHHQVFSASNLEKGWRRKRKRMKRRKEKRKKKKPAARTATPMTSVVRGYNEKQLRCIKRRIENKS